MVHFYIFCLSDPKYPVTIFAKDYPIFDIPELIVVGSMKEGTKIGNLDEADMTLIGNPIFECIFKFDEENQQIVAKSDTIPEAILPFMVGNVFDTTKYMNTFNEQMCKVIKEKRVKVPKGLRLTTDFAPCEVCVSKEDVIPQYVRCRHEPNCQDHAKKKNDPNHKESCDCRVFMYPSITFSKIGIVLHLGKGSTKVEIFLFF